MILISHRGNFDGPDPKSENNPVQINSIMRGGFHCEVDVWYINGHFMLGHDAPTYTVKQRFLENEKLWCHAKTLSALEKMLNNKKIHCFWHQKDDFTITSKGYIWTFPEKPICQKSIIVSLGRKAYG